MDERMDERMDGWMDENENEDDRRIRTVDGIKVEGSG